MLSRGDAPDMTVDELLENDEDDDYSITEEEYDEFVSDTNEFGRGVEVVSAITVFNRMFASGYLTAAEFEERVDEVIDYAESEDDVDMPH